MLGNDMIDRMSMKVIGYIRKGEKLHGGVEIKILAA